MNNTLQESQIKKTSIEVFGLGYVGLPLAVRLAVQGWNVSGIDVNRDRISRLEKNDLFDSELNLKTEFDESRKQGFISFTTEPKKISGSKIGIICVPTPIPGPGIKSDKYVKDAVEKFLDTSKAGDVILVESSVEVGTIDDLENIVKSKGFVIGKDYGLSFCPERIDPQNKEWKLENIPRVIYCSDDVTFQICQNVYYDVNQANITRVSSVKVAEVVKSFENTYRLVNISLVNELAILCDKLGINAGEVISAAATKPFGFKPFYTGAGAGGHCIPKDPLFLLESSKKFGIEFKAIENALEVNSFVPKYIVETIEKTLSKNNLPLSVIVCGMAYKHDLEDMRDSSGFKLYDEFQKKGFQVSAYDPFYKKQLEKKYLIENKMEGKSINLLNDLSNDLIKNFSCLCIVQHHTKSKFRIHQIYQDSMVPLIYDCQNKLAINPLSKTILNSFGGK
ncbi:MAG: nucleotide sugar dehydrogenase [Nitrosopumilus sp.]|nr:nucleotide sugar dehydrogenase [Nitrosopumilus sp.]